MVTCDQKIGSFEGEALDVIEDCSDFKNCVISINQITNFDWDTMYVFRYLATDEDIKLITGISPENLGDSYSSKVVFMKEREVVFFEKRDVDVSSGPDNNAIVFDFGHTSRKFKLFTRESDLFNVERVYFGNEKYYYLLSHQRK